MTFSAEGITESHESHNHQVRPLHIEQLPEENTNKNGDIVATRSMSTNNNSVIEQESRHGESTNQDAETTPRTAKPALTVSDDMNSSLQDGGSTGAKEKFNIEEWVQASEVPKCSRRGLLSRFTIIPELDNALGYSPKVKSMILAQVSLAAVVAPMGASIMLPALNDISADLNVTTTVVNVSFGLYILSLGIFPLWWSGFSELNGRRSVYVVSFTLYTCFQIGCALAPNIAGLMILRIMSGGAAASVQAVGAGTISDIYATTQRGRAMGYFYLGPLCGPLIAPIVGGAIATKWGWRGTQWFCVILGGVMAVCLVFCLPETLKRASDPQTGELERPLDENGEIDIDDVEVMDFMVPIPSRVSRRDHEKSAFYTVHKKFRNMRNAFHHSSSNDKSRPANGAVSFNTTTQPPVPTGERTKSNTPSLMHQVILRPLRAFYFLRFPPVPLSMVYASYCFCSLYFLNIGIETLYSHSPYNFSVIIVGLLYIPNSVGYIISSISNGYWSDRIIARSIQKNGKVVAEDRLAENVFIAAAIFPCALLIFGWAGDKETFWLVPLIGTFLFGIASMLIFGNVTTYLIDALPGRGSSGVALNNFFRMTLAAVATFVAQPLQSAMGFGWLYTMLAIGSVLAFSSIVAIKRWGPYWRETYDVTKFY